MASAELLQRAKAIRFLSCDVDGVLTDGLIHFGVGGGEWKSLAVVDGLGLKMLERSGYDVQSTGIGSASFSSCGRGCGVAQPYCV